MNKSTQEKKAFVRSDLWTKNLKSEGANYELHLLSQELDAFRSGNCSHSESDKNKQMLSNRNRR